MKVLSELFIGKDIEIALTEIRELQNLVDNLAIEEEAKDIEITKLEQQRDQLQRYHY